MRNDLTQIVCILDRSGSMSTLELDTIGGYNRFIESQKEDQGEAWVTTVLFDDKYELLYDAADIKTVQPMTNKEYYARGMTALYDAIGKTIVDIGHRLAMLAEEERPSKVIVVIITDGQENSSKEYDKDRVKEMITHQTQKYNWQFIFMGANIDSAAEAASIGIDEKFSMDYAATNLGTARVYAGADRAVRQMRGEGRVDAGWNSEDDNKVV
ncbi:MAG TPA: VWA domain-containing protein [Clostridiales bacterium]|nr:VWA domain-containing protein [Clostridiales bacterium]